MVDWIVSFRNTCDNVTCGLFGFHIKNEQNAVSFHQVANKVTVGRGSSQTLYFVIIQGYIEASTQTTSLELVKCPLTD